MDPLVKLMLVDMFLEKAIRSLAMARRIREMEDETLKLFIQTELDPARKAEVEKALNRGK